MQANSQAKELLILSQFRINARENLTTASRKIRVPISTIYDRLKKYEGNVIQRHTSLLDFRRLGYAFKMQIILKSAIKDKGELKKFLQEHPRVNTLLTISNDYDYLAEVILKDLEEVEQFNQDLDKFDILDRHAFYIVRDLKREAFLTEYKNFENFY